MYSSGAINATAVAAARHPVGLLLLLYTVRHQVAEKFSVFLEKKKKKLLEPRANL